MSCGDDMFGLPEYGNSCIKHVPFEDPGHYYLQTYFKGYWILWGMRLLNQGHFPYSSNVDHISLPLSCLLTAVWTAARAVTLLLASHVFVLSRHIPNVACESFESECDPLTPATRCCNYFLLFTLLFWRIYIIILFWWLFD